MDCCLKLSSRHKRELRPLRSLGALRRVLFKGAEDKAHVLPHVLEEAHRWRRQGKVFAARGHKLSHKGRLQGPSAVAQGHMQQVPAQRRHP